MDENKVQEQKVFPDFTNYVYILIEDDRYIKGVFDDEKTAFKIVEMFKDISLSVEQYEVFQ